MTLAELDAQVQRMRRHYRDDVQVTIKHPSDGGFLPIVSVQFNDPAGVIGIWSDPKAHKIA